MWKPLALVAVCCAVVGSQIAQADEGQPSTAPNVTASAPCTPWKQIYSEKRWRESHPLKGQTPCLTGARRDSAGLRRTKEHFFLYRHYRLISPFHYGAGDKWLRWTPIPAAVVGCEGGTWNSHNPSGADGPAQMLGHQHDYGQPADVNQKSSPETKVQYWDSVHALYRDSGLSPWSPSSSCWA